MIELTNTAQQTIPVGGSLVFDKKLIQAGCCECHRTNTPAVKMRQRGYYEVTFNGNIGGATAATAVQIALQLGGATLLETTMISVPAAANDLNNVSADTFLSNCCDDYDRITVVNTGAVPVIVGANASIKLKRVCG